MKNQKVRINMSIILITMLIFGLVGCSRSKETNNSIEAGTETSTDTNADNNTDASADTSTSSDEKIVLNIADFKTYPTTAHTIIAEYKGFFDEEFTEDNIEVNIYRFINGPAVNEAFASGSIDVGPVGEQPLLTGIANTKAGKIIAIGERARGTFGLFVKGDSEITDITQLKGKKIGIGIGTNAQKIFVQWLVDAGLQESDVELINIPVPADALTSLLAGDIDATPNSLLSYWDSYQSGEIKVIKNNEDIPNYVGYEARTEYLEEHQDIVVRYLKVLNRAYEWEKDHIEEAAAIIEEATGLSKEAVVELLPKVDLNLSIQEDDITALNKTYDFLVANDLISSDFNTDDYIDDYYIKEALGEE